MRVVANKWLQASDIAQLFIAYHMRWGNTQKKTIANATPTQYINNMGQRCTMLVRAPLKLDLLILYAVFLSLALNEKDRLTLLGPQKWLTYDPMVTIERSIRAFGDTRNFFPWVHQKLSLTNKEDRLNDCVLHWK